MRWSSFYNSSLELPSSQNPKLQWVYWNTLYKNRLNELLQGEMYKTDNIANMKKNTKKCNWFFFLLLIYHDLCLSHLPRALIYASHSPSFSCSCKWMKPIKSSFVLMVVSCIINWTSLHACWLGPSHNTHSITQRENSKREKKQKSLNVLKDSEKRTQRVHWIGWRWCLVGWRKSDV